MLIKTYCILIGLVCHFKKIVIVRFSPLCSLKVSNYLFDQQRRNASKSYSYESLISLVLGFDCGSKIHI